MRVRINRLLSPVTVLGPGRRVGLWVQGCTLACTGCASVDTWAPAAGSSVAVSALVERIVARMSDAGLTGLTVTGGEPFQQADAVLELVQRVREEAPVSVDVLVFTGYALAAAQRISAELVGAADALVAGPYRRDRAAGGPLVASDNQRLVVGTALGRERFAGWDVHTDRPRMQVAVDGQDLHLVGLPRPGDLDRLREQLRQRGVEMAGVTWQS